MINNQKDLYDFIDKIMKPNGFVKKKDTWYSHSDECVTFLHVGKSPYGGYYGEVLGCFLKEICLDKKEDFPKYYTCDLKYGIGKIIGNKELVKKVFDLENSEFKANEREIILKELIENYALPFLKDIRTKNGIKTSLEKYSGLTTWMNVDMKKALSIGD